MGKILCKMVSVVLFLVPVVVVVLGGIKPF